MFIKMHYIDFDSDRDAKTFENKMHLAILKHSKINHYNCNLFLRLYLSLIYCNCFISR
jgi:hypothetical protein